jgi:hypothetical protein
LQEERCRNLPEEQWLLREVLKAGCRAPTSGRDELAQLCRRLEQFREERMTQLVQNSRELLLEIPREDSVSNRPADY